MKDLYTFDSSQQAALASYEEVRQTYAAIFDDLRLDYVVAEASSGSIGGDLSHEYHLRAEVGEDTLLTCPSCSYSCQRRGRSRPNGGRTGYQRLHRRLFRAVSARIYEQNEDWELLPGSLKQLLSVSTHTATTGGVEYHVVYPKVVRRAAVCLVGLRP